jgi:polysaccharide biosynthesis transport protein
MRELQRQADAARSIYQAFLLRAQETMEASNVDTTNSRIITRALRPQQKSWPPTLLLLLASGLGGLSLGASATLAREYLNPSLLTSAQARQIVDAPVLGVVAGRDLARERVASSAPRSHGKTADNVARSLLRKLPNVASPDEAKIGACIYLASPSSAAAARARFAERLADFSVREGRQTLLVDADLSAASHADRGGLLEVLRGEQTVSDLAYIETDDRYSRLAKGGTDPEDWRPRENNDAFRLRRMRRCYDLVILDGGSMTDNDRLASLAGQCDLLALVAEIGQPQADAAAEVEAAALAEGKFDAIVLVDPTNAL